MPGVSMSWIFDEENATYIDNWGWPYKTKLFSLSPRELQ